MIFSSLGVSMLPGSTLAGQGVATRPPWSPERHHLEEAPLEKFVLLGQTLGKLTE
jgi:hypothetical protein